MLGLLKLSFIVCDILNLTVPVFIYFDWILTRDPERIITRFIIPMLTLFSVTFFICSIFGFLYRYDKQPLLARSTLLTTLSFCASYVMVFWIIFVDAFTTDNTIMMNRGWCSSSEILMGICCLNLTVPMIIRSYRLKKIFSDNGNAAEQIVRSFSLFSNISDIPKGDLYRGRYTSSFGEWSRNTSLTSLISSPGGISGRGGGSLMSPFLGLVDNPKELTRAERRLTDLNDHEHINGGTWSDSFSGVDNLRRGFASADNLRRGLLNTSKQNQTVSLSKHLHI